MMEGVFNIMGDKMDSRSSSLSTTSVNATQYFKTEDPLFTPVFPGFIQKMINASAVRSNKLAT